MMQTDDALARAIAYLCAVEVGDPDPAHNGPWYAYYSDDTDRWCCIDDESLRMSLEDLERGLYADCAHAMPRWWSPAQRFIVYNDDGDFETYATLDDAECSDLGRRVWTADLETGEEIPA